MASKLSFPNEATIKNYLENEHPLTKDDLYMKKKKVLEAAARTFADKEKVPMGINLGLTLMLHDIGYDVPHPAYTITIINLSEALKDCAEGKHF
jgi:hypothetical protein